MTPPLHDYQELAIKFLHNHAEAALLLDCGYGKTRIVLEALEPRHLPALVVAPKRVAEHVWPDERQLWTPSLDMALAVGDPPKRKAALDAKASLTVIGRDSLKDVKPGGYATIVFDELSAYKDRGTSRWKMARRLAKEAEHVWGLTGTPSPNGLLDLWAQVYLLDGGKRFDTSVQRFRNRYFNDGRRIANGTVVSWNIKPEGEAAIHRALEDLCLSITDKIKLPPITYNRINFDIPLGVREAYREFARELLVDLDILGGDVHTAANEAVLTGKLSQLTAGFLYHDNREQGHDWLHNGKIDALEEIVQGTGDNLLVFYRFGAEREAIKQRFPKATHINDPGAIPAWMRGEVPMLLTHPASAAHGLNLQNGGHTIVWMTLDWSLETWHQANSRLYRQGQEHPVVVHIVEATNTIDRRILRRIHGKKEVQNSLIDHLSSPM